ncbi:sensor histidine kinase [Microbacterium stercoris]|uniref:histidine kinase n=1 Tax=Microbacterium stercoris TaxID=2820289 RepID=A0A939QQR1_9MICO|nr:sensor histidine kinase [Microbacterium stercoris]MBO3662921.1 sensor histidine kinase [Microbacterium stercoris]
MPAPALSDGWGEARDPRRGRWIAFAAAIVAAGASASRALWWTPTSGLLWLSAAATVAAAVALLLIDRWPALGVAVSGGLAIVALAVHPVPPPFALLPLLLAIARGVRHGAVWWSSGIAAGSVLVPLSAASVFGVRLLFLPALLVVIASAVTLAVSLAVRTRQDRMERLRASFEERRQTEADRERVRIARELHDVLAHSLSSISVQAGVALHLADRDPTRAQDTLRDIRRTSTQALDEVRQVLGVLRGEEAAALAPEPDLSALPELIRDAERLGLTVELDDRLSPRPTGTAQLAVHRLLREALTNAARHAPGSHVRLSLRWEGSEIVAEVVDDGAARPVEPSSGSGRGILGMRERAALLGGTLEAGPEGSGFAVRARIPAEREHE